MGERDPRDRNNETGFAAVAGWCAARRVPLAPYAYRLAMVLLTESSGGLIFANDGRDFGAGMPRTFNADGTPWSEAKRLHVVEVLRTSLPFPHDREDSDGYSTGPIQQISRDAVQAAGLGAWGWGSIAETMNPARAAVMFVEKCTVTDNAVYVKDGQRVETPDPIAADVLRTQNPAPREAASSNYSASQVALARRMADAYMTGTFRFFTDREHQR